MREHYTDTFSISFYCRPSRKSTKGDCPIQMAINLQGKRYYISLPRKADSKSFKKMMISQKPNERLDRIKDLFLFQCYTGLSYCDMELLEPKDFQSNEAGMVYLRKKRKKTGVLFFIVLLPEALNIAKKYSLHLPLISNEKYNSYLKELGTLCNIDKPMHSHIGRHTAATYLLNRSVPMEMVAKVLGHTTTKQTRHYAKLLDKTVFDEFKKLM